jgi:hypothetical protein
MAISGRQRGYSRWIVVYSTGGSTCMVFAICARSIILNPFPNDFSIEKLLFRSLCLNSFNSRTSRLEMSIFLFLSLTPAQAPATKSGRLAGRALGPIRNHLACLVADFASLPTRVAFRHIFFADSLFLRLQQARRHGVVVLQASARKSVRLAGQALAECEMNFCVHSLCLEVFFCGKTYLLRSDEFGHKKKTFFFYISHSHCIILYLFFVVCRFWTSQVHLVHLIRVVKARGRFLQLGYFTLQQLIAFFFASIASLAHLR